MDQFRFQEAGYGSANEISQTHYIRDYLICGDEVPDIVTIGLMAPRVAI